MSERNPIVLGDSRLRLRQCRHGPMLFATNDTYIGQSLYLYGEFSPSEGALFEGLVEPGHTIIDAGANVGCFTVLFSKLAGPNGRVFAFEPQRVVYQILCANLALNGARNVDARQNGLGSTTASYCLPKIDYDCPGNFGAPSLFQNEKGESVSVTTIDDLDLGACHLIKADVQGMEADVLAGAARTITRFRPLLYLENDTKDKSETLLQAVLDMDYRAYWHLPPLFEMENCLEEPLNVFGNTVSVNLLCVSRGSDLVVAGLQEVQSADEWWQAL